MTYRSELRFLLNDGEESLQQVGAQDTLLDFLRIRRRLTGTKEGCAEGDCGACTVLVGRPTDAGLRYEAVNACIRFMASLDGCHVVTIEHLRGADGGLHPVQQAMVDFHGSQCGFCTPGIVMALYALWMETPKANEAEIEEALQGNLCRCTGYAPIIRAALAAGQADPAGDPLLAERADVTARLEAMRDGKRVELGGEGHRAILPANIDDLAAVLQERPDATIVAGATDVGLWVTKHLKDIAPVVHVGHLNGLRGISRDDDALTIGAGASYSDVQDALAEAFPHLRDYWRRIAGWQVRNMGTIGGNIANGSPIGDTPPVFIALDAVLVLRKGAVRREMPLADFFVDYGKQDRTAGEFVEALRVPLDRISLHAAYKVSKRRDEDITSVALGARVRLDAGRVTEARLAFGGMAATPKRAKAAEAALVGQDWSEASLRNAMAALSDDFSPLSDMRATADYRAKVAQNLLLRFYMEHSGADVRLQSA